MLEFREPHTEAQFRQLLEFRQLVYAQNTTLKSLSLTPDLSAFDARAHHYTAFENDRPVAYMRMVQRSETKFGEWVHRISGNALVPAETQFPFEQYAPDKAWNRAFLERFESEKTGEAGKLAIAQSHRSDRFLKDFVKAFLVYAIHDRGFDSGFGVCTHTLERFYRRLGFYRSEGSQPFVYKDLPAAVLVQFDARSFHHSA